MADPTFEPGLMTKAVDWVWAFVVGVIGILWKGNERKLDNIEAKLAGKADSEDVKRALSHIEAIFKAQESDREKTRDRFDEFMRVQHSQYENLINMINGRRKNGQ